MDKQKIYIIQASFSSYDSHYFRTIKAFFRREDAEKYIIKANRVLGEMSIHIDKATRMRKIDDELFIGLSYEEIKVRLDEIESSEEYLKALAIWDAHSNIEEFNECKIIEIEIQ